MKTKEISYKEAVDNYIKDLELKQKQEHPFYKSLSLVEARDMYFKLHQDYPTYKYGLYFERYEKYRNLVDNNINYNISISRSEYDKAYPKEYECKYIPTATGYDSVMYGSLGNVAKNSVVTGGIYSKGIWQSQDDSEVVQIKTNNEIKINI